MQRFFKSADKTQGSEIELPEVFGYVVSKSREQALALLSADEAINKMIAEKIMPDFYDRTKLEDTAYCQNLADFLISHIFKISEEEARLILTETRNRGCSSSPPKMVLWGQSSLEPNESALKKLTNNIATNLKGHYCRYLWLNELLKYRALPAGREVCDTLCELMANIESREIRTLAKNTLSLALPFHKRQQLANINISGKYTVGGMLSHEQETDLPGEIYHATGLAPGMDIQDAQATLNELLANPMITSNTPAKKCVEENIRKIQKRLMAQSQTEETTSNNLTSQPSSGT